MIKISIPLFLWLSSLALSAQDTTYFGKHGMANMVLPKKATRIRIVSELENGIQHVEFWQWPRTRLESVQYFKQGDPVGKWIEYNESGEIRSERDFGKLIYLSCSDPASVPEQDRIIEDTTHVNVMPQFKGGLEELYKFLGRTVRYPREAVDQGISGKVYIQGKVDATGKWQTKQICLGAHPYLDLAAWQALDLMPDWEPGTMDGKPVDVLYQLPVSFTLR